MQIIENSRQSNAH